jgi:hypothetical protein
MVTLSHVEVLSHLTLLPGRQHIAFPDAMPQRIGGSYTFALQGSQIDFAYYGHIIYIYASLHLNTSQAVEASVSEMWRPQTHP